MNIEEKMSKVKNNEKLVEVDRFEDATALIIELDDKDFEEMEKGKPVVFYDEKADKIIKVCRG